MPETESENGQNIIYVYPRVKTSLNGHFLKTTFLQKPLLYKDHIVIKF